MVHLSKLLLCFVAVALSCCAKAGDMEWRVNIKQPGNKSVSYRLTENGDKLVADGSLPLSISKSVKTDGADEVITITFKAEQTTYFNFGAKLQTGFSAGDSEFYLPGFWYHKNLRSPKNAPSFHTSKSWNFREDRLSSPLTSVYNTKSGEAVSVLRELSPGCESLTTHTEGEVILSGNTSIGYLGFDNSGFTTELTFGYPYDESPRRYIRKLTLAEPVTAFVKIEKGETKSISWRIHKTKADSYGDFVAEAWKYCFDCLKPEPITPKYTPEKMKEVMSNYFRKSFNDKYELKFNSGHSIKTDDCTPVPHMQIAFCGRVLLNAFNSLEYGEQTKQTDLVDIGNAIFDSFLAHGFTAKGYLYDNLDLSKPKPADNDVVHSIRQQSEAAYAVMHFLRYEKLQGRKHKEWEAKIRTILDNFVAIQKQDGSFARKFRDDGTDIDASGGSTPSATSTLVMGYKYFGDKRYLKAAERTVEYLEQNIIAPSDYFSSTLDANCEDKEAAISAVTATYYMAMMTKGKARQHYIDLCNKAAFFALSWYYMWDVPFAKGQMLGELGFQSRGWGNVSVENNHIDVFVFELPHIVKWLASETGEERFSKMYDVIYSSLNQLLPVKERMCGIQVEGFYPEVVQHTTWDYGRNGKGFYNDYFAPGWTVASLWELYSPTRTTDFLLKK